MQTIEQRYASLLVEYCLEIQPGDRLLVQTSTLGIPLLKEVHLATLRAGGNMMTDIEWSGLQSSFYREANEEQLQWINPAHKHAFEEFEAYLLIRAPYNLREAQNIPFKKKEIRNTAVAPLYQIYNQRTATRELKRSLCQYPTHASAQEARMSLDEYKAFVFDACRLNSEDPVAAWLQVREEQSRYVDLLNRAKKMRFQNEHTDISFSVEDRVWINSDGRTNMPSGEVFSAPVEDSVNGVIYFDFPSIYRGHEVQGITLNVQDGLVTSWSAERGQQVLDEVFGVEGARRFGEVAIGTNYNIKRATKNILFDEKIGGTIHMAVGQAYIQTGGKNKSMVHWDMIADMKKDGMIWADDQKIYERGQFLI